MKKKVLGMVLVLGLLWFVGCSKDSSTAPETPQEPQKVTYTVQLQIGVVATLSPTYVFDVYAGASDVFLKTLTIPAGSIGTGTVNVSASFEMLKDSSEETFPIKWKLMSCSLGSTWASAANYQYWMTVVPISSGITVDPKTQQRVGPFKGWDIGEVKQLTFKVKTI